MKQASYFIAIAFMVAFATRADNPSDEKQILQLEDLWVRAMNTKDRQLLDKIIAPSFTFIEPDGTVKNRAEYLADRSSDKVETESFENIDLKVQVLGNFAIASGLAKITERREGKRYRFQARWKEMWMKNNGKWQVLTSQATPVNPKWDADFVIPK
jgi:hypothetical protein